MDADSIDDLQQQRRHLQQAYEEDLDALTRQQNQVEQEAQDLAQRGTYYLHKIRPEADSRDIYQLAQRFQMESQDILQQQKRKVTADYEEQNAQLTSKIRRQADE